MFKKYNIKNYNFRLVIYLIALTIIGILVIGSAKQSVQTKQILGLILGVVVMVIVSLIDYEIIMKASWILYGISVVLLLLVLIAGVNRGGATRWILIPIIDIQFQPSELAKVLLIIFYANFLSKHKDKLNTFKYIALAILLIGVPLFLILREPDLSTSIVTVLIFITLLFIAGLSYKIVIATVAVTVPTLIVSLYLLASDKLSFLHGYQNKRIMAWLHPEDYPDEALQQKNSMMAIGSGQLLGKGLYNTDSTSVKNGNFISEPQTDFIFAVAGEELGFLGSVIIIILLLLIAVECLVIAKRAKDLSGRLICCGMGALIAYQSFVNVCVVTGLMPNTGLPLPFVSYGLTSLVTLFAGMGLVLNVGLQSGSKYNNVGVNFNEHRTYSS